MQTLETIVPLRDYCRSHKWPRLPQWHHWIYVEAPVAKACVKKIGGRYLIDCCITNNSVTQNTKEADDYFREMRRCTS